jgi:hypothetical protein
VNRASASSSQLPEHIPEESTGLSQFETPEDIQVETSGDSQVGMAGSIPREFSRTSPVGIPGDVPVKTPGSTLEEMPRVQEPPPRAYDIAPLAIVEPHVIIVGSPETVFIPSRPIPEEEPENIPCQPPPATPIQARDS